MSDDDLDALLDEAMDMVDEQERKHEEDVRVRDAKLEDDLQKALDESSGAGGEGDMMKMFMSMLGGAGGADGADAASMEGFKKSVMAMVSSLEGEEGLGDEDKANLERVKELMNVMEDEDIDKANEVLEQMKKDGSLPEDDKIGDADVDSASKKCMEMLKQISQATEGGTPVPPPPAAASTSATAAAGPSSGGAPTLPEEFGEVPENIATVLVAALTNPEFVEPIKVMRDAYGPYLEAHGASMSQGDRERYESQRAKSVEICEFLKVPIKDDSDVRLVPLLELMHEFSELGQPPENLAEYAPKRHTAAVPDLKDSKETAKE